VSQKSCAKMLLSEVRQMFTNFDNFFGRQIAQRIGLCEMY